MFHSSPEGTPITSRRFDIKLVLPIIAHAIVWASLIYMASTLVLAKALEAASYLYFSLVTATIGVLASLSVGRPTYPEAFLGLSTVTVLLLLEEALLNGLHPDAGLAIAFTAALAMPLAGSIPKLKAEVKYALQATGLIFASRLAFIPFPQMFLKVSTAPPSIYSLIISLVIAFIVVKRVSLKRVGLTIGPYPIAKQISTGASVGILSGLIEYSILQPKPIELTGNHLQSILYVIIVMTLFVGFGEELLFRGLVQEAYQNVLPAWSAIFMASVQFGLMHYGWLNPLEILFAYGMGVTFGYSFWKTKSLIAPITIHSLGNIIMFHIAAYPELMLTPTATQLIIIISVVLLLPALPWRKLPKPEMNIIRPASPIGKEYSQTLKQHLTKLRKSLLQAVEESRSLARPLDQQKETSPETPAPQNISLCSYCGRELAANMKYCDWCGQQLLLS